MELGFFNLNTEPQCKENYLQHITSIINIELVKGDTYNILFKKLRDRFEGEPGALMAADGWITHNEESQEGKSVFDTVICDDDKCYAVFNLID